MRSAPISLAKRLQTLKVSRPLRLMEVCGTHTVAIHRNGIQHLLPENVKLVSGPGCPVCVTPGTFIEEAVYLAGRGNTIATFGDLVRVPGRTGSLQEARAEGADIRVVYSPLDALEIAVNEPQEVIFLAIGFETTIPGIAVTIQEANARGIENFSVLCAMRLVPPALQALLNDTCKIDGFLLPGHVSTVLGVSGYSVLEEKKTPGVISGFEPGDIISSLLLLLEMIEANDGKVINNYRRVVADTGNEFSRRVIKTVFTPVAAEWRGIGTIPESGLTLGHEFRFRDARKRFNPPVFREESAGGCRCGDVLKGLIDPPECGLFQKSCSPETPQGPCMVSTEGSCQAWYRYG